MPFKSQAQRRKFYAMADRGEISPSTVKRWEEHTPKDKKLPKKKKEVSMEQRSKMTKKMSKPKKARQAAREQEWKESKSYRLMEDIAKSVEKDYASKDDK